ncbi:MAG: di-trans,poly-cis-decaprenylcistransferase [SAR86 cluster bacterium]|uniref:Ditrans,polycis-undecaprenyl-diphosphate synthase ((2E,6E)-farnesyl-diphosphate specific) n=1 Tax=SAR86 cluster bacterium TaxID=2030880 RepID=A0A2A4XD83_9GAMM|nr:MAG: di-trans,poly-cis-decaprenylcistransferase [SAR86 cluster bacterium]
MTPASKPELPQHIAIVMDGNNRWAKSRDLPAKSGHRYGAEVARGIVNSCLARDIKYLTLFAFSSENWLRPRQEVRGLMALFLSVLKRKEINQLHKRNVRLQFIGNRSSFSQKLQRNMHEVEELTRNNTGMTVIVAADYGGRWDIANAVSSIVGKVTSGELSADAIDEDLVRQYTSSSDYPDPDLCIRTGGENRISNFLLWQFAYTELYFTDCYWPDFDDAQFQLALDDFAKRQRRYGSHDDQEYTSD